MDLLVGDDAMSSRARRPSVTHLPPLDDPPATVLDWLAERFPRVSRERWISRMERGLVLEDRPGNRPDADPVPLGVGAPYRPHLRLLYYREVEDEPRIPFAERILHEDEHLVVADKPSFLPVTPGGRYVTECLLARLRRRFGDDDLAPVHRLDRHTSGVVLFARREAERGAYSGLFARGEIEKVYEALARPPGEDDDEADEAGRRWTVESLIVPGEPFFRMREAPGEPDARSEIEAVGPVGDGAWRYRLRPLTGKKHQLRLHMARIGRPIAGDRWYPELLPEGPDDVRDPLRLVARRLAFRDPVTGEGRSFESTYDVTSLHTVDLVIDPVLDPVDGS